MPTILIVDDEPGMRKYLAAVLRQAGYRSLEAANGSEALRKVRSERPDLVIADILMPAMSGFEFVQRVRNDLEIAATRVIFTTGVFQDDEALQLAQACGVLHVLAKPSRPQEILQLVDGLLSASPPASPTVLPGDFEQEQLHLLTNKLMTKIEELQNANRRLEQEIAERTRTEERLRQSEALLAEAQHLAQIGSWNWDLQSGAATWSDEHYRLFGLDPQATPMTYDRFMSFVHPDDRARVKQLGDQALRDHQPFEYTFRIRHGDGTVRLLLARGQVVLDATGHPVRLFGTDQDITERKQHEDALAESRRRFQAVFENSLDATLLLDDAGCYVDGNPAICQLLGYSRAELLQKRIGDLTPVPERGRVPGVWSALLAAGRLSGEHTLLCKDGSTRAVEFRAVANILPGLHLAVHRDISERKQAEQTLRASEERYRLLFEGNLAGVVISTLEGRLLDCNDAFVRIVGYASRDEILAHPARDFYFDPADRQAYLAELARHKSVSNYELRFRRQDGQLVWVLGNARWLGSEAGTPFLYGTVIDITERKRAEEALRESEERFAAFMRFLPGAAWIKDLHGRYVFANDTGQRVFGHPLSALRGKTDEELFDRDTAVQFRENDRRALMSGEVLETMETLPQEDGLHYSIVKKFPIFDPQGAPILIGGVAFDVTERKRAEEKLREYTERLQALSRRLVEVQEEERRHLAGELHDEIGQLLTSVKFAVEAGLSAPAKSADARLGEARNLLEEALARIRKLSFDLRPALLDHFGLLPALRALIERYTAFTGVAVNFKQAGLERRFAPALETAIYRIVQEALTNVARHAQVREAAVRVWVDVDSLEVQVEDEGVGFDHEAVLAVGRSSGLPGMHERVLLLGGRLAVESSAGSGTHLLAQLPLDGQPWEKIHEHFDRPGG